MHRVRNELLVPFITRLPGTSDAPWIEEERARLIVVETGEAALKIAPPHPSHPIVRLPDADLEERREPRVASSAGAQKGDRMNH
jgi:hypothetical protein